MKYVVIPCKDEQAMPSYDTTGCIIATTSMTWLNLCAQQARVSRPIKLSKQRSDTYNLVTQLSAMVRHSDLTLRDAASRKVKNKNITHVRQIIYDTTITSSLPYHRSLQPGCKD